MPEEEEEACPEETLAEEAPADDEPADDEVPKDDEPASDQVSEDDEPADDEVPADEDDEVPEDDESMLRLAEAEIEYQDAVESLKKANEKKNLLKGELKEKALVQKQCKIAKGPKPPLLPPPRYLLGLARVKREPSDDSVN